MAPSTSQLAQQVKALQGTSNVWLEEDNAESRESLRQAALEIVRALEPPVEISDRLSYEVRRDSMVDVSK